MKKWMLIVCKENGQYYFFNGNWPTGVNPTAIIVWREWDTKMDTYEQWQEAYWRYKDEDMEQLNSIMNAVDLSVFSDYEFNIAGKDFKVVQTGNFAFTK